MDHWNHLETDYSLALAKQRRTVSATVFNSIDEWSGPQSDQLATCVSIKRPTSRSQQWDGSERANE